MGIIADSPRRQMAPSPRMPAPTSAAGSKEFDPLSTQRSVEANQDKVMSSFGIANNGKGILIYYILAHFMAQIHADGSCTGQTQQVD